MTVGESSSKKMKPRSQDDLRKDCGAAAFAYLHETTVHGFRYLSNDGMGRRNCAETLFWVAVISGAFAATTIMLYRSFHEATEFPILTTIDTVSVKEVPFPAVTIDSGRVINPWGFAERLLDLIDYECYKTPENCTEKEAGRQQAMVVIRPVVKRFFDIVIDQIKDEPLSELRNTRDSLMFAKSWKFPEFDDSASMLALIMKANKQRGINVFNRLAEATAQTFAMINPAMAESRAVNFGSKYFYPIVKAEADKISLTEDEVKACVDDPEGCPASGEYQEAYATLLLPFLLNRVPYNGLGIGQLVSYFSWRVLSLSKTQTLSGTRSTFLNNVGDNNKQSEIEVADMLTNITNHLAGKEVGISTYELVNMVDSPHRNDENVAHAPYAGDHFGCTSSQGSQTQKYYRAWKSYTEGKTMDRLGLASSRVMQRPCTNGTLDESLGITACCDMTRAFNEEHDLIGRVLKFAIQAPHFTQSRQEFDFDFGNAHEYIPVKLKTYAEGRTPLGPNPRIRMCRYNQNPASESNEPYCNMFVRSYSNEGIAYSFNGRKFWNKHKRENLFNQRFYELMHPEPLEDLPDIIHPTTSGAFYGLSVVLQLNKYEDELRGTEFGKILPAFRVSIHDPHKPADMRSEAIKVEPGYSSTFLITPNQVVTSDAIKGLSLEKRNCKFHSENEDLRIFSKYTQEACKFECQLTQAEAKCGCVPWNYPRMANDTPVCDYMGVNCFEEVMSDTTVSEKCFCPYDCDTTRYGYSVSSTALDFETLCPTDTKLGEQVYAGISSELPDFMPQFMRNYEQRINGMENNDRDICMKALKSMAFVNFQLASQTVTQIKREQRVSFSDHVSNFGGTIGLFTGMSIVSIAELLFWGLRLLTGWTQEEECKNETEQEDNRRWSSARKTGVVTTRPATASSFYDPVKKTSDSTTGAPPGFKYPPAYYQE